MEFDISESRFEIYTIFYSFFMSHTSKSDKGMLSDLSEANLLFDLISIYFDQFAYMTCLAKKFLGNGLVD